MKDRITDEIINNISILSKLELSESEKNVAKKDMEEMLYFIDKLNELDTEEVKPLSHAFSYNNVFREDEVVNGDKSLDMLKNAPDVHNKYFKVPKTIG